MKLRFATLLAAATWAAAACGQPASTGGEQFLVIGASEASAQRIAVRAQQLAKASGRPGLVLQVGDCGDARRLFAWSAAVTSSAAEAQQALAQLQRSAPDAYVKRCKVRPGSLLALRVPAVDPSIARVPAQVVNWSEEDRISAVVPLGGTGSAVLVRRYEAAPDDPLEGRRTRVALASGGGELVTLAEDCSGASQFVRGGSWLAFACDTEQAADHVLHTVRAFDDSGVPGGTLPRCRTPAITASGMLACQGEEVDAAGQLKLTPRSLKLAPR
ncbi:hypothetical protein LZ009_20175 [Ramlibacter sp. XY19]|uniref:hypothetical protein n=1 Tax=Ramlibacter paludis TaxID=2908000 RepID=UPI0023DCA73B|nr:hypothetical protein [Ramlibacter paludis]MCG2595102.1 hypothetical protein [Ramlibacter paludis]